jgi:hypothetical protein
LRLHENQETKKGRTDVIQSEEADVLLRVGKRDVILSEVIAKQ